MPVNFVFVYKSNLYYSHVQLKNGFQHKVNPSLKAINL